MERYIEKFIRYLEIEKNYSQHTVLNYRLDLEDFKAFLADKPVEEVDYLMLRKYLAVLKQKNLSSRTVNRRLSTLRSFFKFLTREGYFKTNPMLAVSSPKQEKHLPLFLTEEEVKRLIDAVIPEPAGGAHTDHRVTAKRVMHEVQLALGELERLEPGERLRLRHEKYLKMGRYATANSR